MGSARSERRHLTRHEVHVGSIRNWAASRPVESSEWPMVIEGKDRARTTSVSGVRFCLRFDQLKRLWLPASSLSDTKYNGLLGKFCPDLHRPGV